MRMRERKRERDRDRDRKRERGIEREKEKEGHGEKGLYGFGGNKIFRPLPSEMRTTQNVLGTFT